MHILLKEVDLTATVHWIFLATKNVIGPTRPSGFLAHTSYSLVAFPQKASLTTSTVGTVARSSTPHIGNRDAEGSLHFSQIAAPDLHGLDQHILHSSMTEKDVVLFCGFAGYIRQSVAKRIVGARSNHRFHQHGLLASAPTINASDNTGNNLDTSSSPPRAVAEECRFEVPSTIPTPAAENYEWTGSMSDLYHPSEGSIDFDGLLRSYNSNPWETTSIHDPKAFGTFIENGGMQDGFLAPVVPDNPEHS
ncbi:hypothetical protein VTL71DRAFT_3118 [Oculimacula yallundae]|uniref:Uncharacterized protein n=1 Tax=Oculimacula yallundae TaxID=86028 RepID=A0ABR4C676_9HELO